MMAFPTLTTRVSFSTGPLATPVWVDISAYVKEFKISRGREHERARTKAGTAQVVLDNSDGRFSPNLSTGPYFPNVVPMKRINIRAEYPVGSGTFYELFTGFVESWPPKYTGPDDEMTIDCVDAFKLFAQASLDGLFPAQLSSARVTAVLDALGWPAADRSIATGQTTVQSSLLEDETAIEHLLKVQETEGGLLFVNGAGKVVFQDRHARFKAPYITSQATFAGTAVSPQLGYQSLDVAYDDSQIYNEIRLTRVGGTEQVVSDATSQAAYLKRTQSQTGLLHTLDNEVLDNANWRLARYRDPHLRVQSITVQNGDDAAWPHLLGRELGDRITVVYGPAGINEPFYIEGISDRFLGAHDWETSWMLSPVAGEQFWVLGVTGLSELGLTTVLGF